MIRLRALRGKMGTTEYFMTTATFGEVARIVNYKENSKDWPLELRQQRPLNMSRVRNHMVQYLVESEDHFYNALVVEHVRPGGMGNAVRFVSDDDSDMGWVELEGSETLEALDGQHRLKSIELAVAQSPDLARETIGLIIVPHRSVRFSQQLFSDLNKNAKPTPKSLNILFEQREEEALLAKQLVEGSAYLKGRVNMTGSSLSTRSPYIVTISTLYEAVKIVLPVLPKTSFESRASALTEMWDITLEALPGIQDLSNGDLTAGELRSTYIYASGVGFEALAEALRVAVQGHPNTWREILRQGLPRISWQLKDQQWEGVALFAGRIAIARAARRRSGTLVKYLLGLEVDSNDKEELIEVYGTMQYNLPSPVLQPEKVA